WQTRNKQKLVESLDETEEKQEILSGIIEQLSATSDKLIESSSQLKFNYNSNQETMGDIVSQINEISNGADTQKKQTVNSSNSIQEIVTGIQHIASTSSDVSHSSLKTRKEANDGNDRIQRAVQHMNASIGTVSKTSERLKLLNNRSRESGKFVGLITDRSSQTKRLALSAAIEASRVGEYGKVFAVVANEV